MFRSTEPVEECLVVMWPIAARAHWTALHSSKVISAVCAAMCIPSWPCTAFISIWQYQLHNNAPTDPIRSPNRNQTPPPPMLLWLSPLLCLWVSKSKNMICHIATRHRMNFMERVLLEGTARWR